MKFNFDVLYSQRAWSMILGHTDGLSELGSSRDPLIAYPESELNVEDDEEQILYAASFEELAKNHVKYDTIIWISISLLLVLAWGIGIIMLLCFPIRRYMLQKDISSRKLYVTANEIVYKVLVCVVFFFFLWINTRENWQHRCNSYIQYYFYCVKFSRPSILFWRVSTIEKCIPLSLVIDIIIEQGIDAISRDFCCDRFPLLFSCSLFHLLDKVYNLCVTCMIV